MAEIVDIGQAQNLGKLLAQSNLHLVFGGIDAVFRQPARFDVAIEDDDFMAALGDFLRGEHSRWSGTDHEYGLHMVLRMLHHRLSWPLAENAQKHPRREVLARPLSSCVSLRM